MSTRLTLGAAAALVGLAALSSRGSRSGAGASIFGVRVHPLVGYSSIEELDESNPMVMSGMVRDPLGRQEPFCVRWLELEAFIDEASRWEGIHGIEWTMDAFVLPGLRQAADWLSGLEYPLEVYRGIRVRSLDEVQLRDDHRLRNPHWTVNPKVAQAFALGIHSASEPSSSRPGPRIGVVLRGVSTHIEAREIARLVRNFLVYSAEGPGGPPDEVTGQWEVSPADSQTVEIWKVLR